MKLTKKAIDSLKYDGDGKSQFIKWDDELKGFGLRVFPTGRKSFVLSYRSSGRKHIMTLGQFGVLTLDQGRKLAREKLVSVNQGGDPLTDKKKASQGQTVKDLCEAYLERYAKVQKKTWKEDERRIDRHILPAWKSIQVKSIRREDIAKIHNKLGASAPYEANRLLALISKMFSLAEEWGFLPEGTPNQASKINKFKEKQRDRWITSTELPKLTKAIDTEPNLYIRSVFWLYLLSGARRSELLKAKWSDVDFDRQELKIAESKAGRVHYYPLTPEAVKLLETIPKLEGNEHIFPGARKGKPLVNISKAWKRIKENAKISDIRIHDLRRTVGSWLATSGNSLVMIGKILGHSNASTTQIYARLGEEGSRKALESHSKQIMGVSGKTPKAQIVEIDEIKKKRK
jgi:integrase